MTDDPVLTVMLPIEIEATLTLTYTDPRTNTQRSRPVTAADLRKLRLRHEDDMYDVTCRNLRTLGFDESEGIGAELRYFIEHTTHWDGVHEFDPTNFAALTEWAKTQNEED